MLGRLRLGILAFGAVALAALALHPGTAAAQEASSRFRVLVPDLQAREGADRKFGEKVADRLRDLINELPTHQPISEKELKRALKRFKMKMQDLDCVKTRQLGQQIEAQLVFCGSYTKTDGTYRIEGSFVARNGETFQVDPVEVGEKQQDEAAQHFFASLDRLTQQLRFAQFCGEYALSKQWENALTNCQRAVELNPGSISSYYTMGIVLREMGRNEEALEAFKKTLELDPLHEDAMQNAGYVSALLGREDDARRYYREYLDLNPANAQVRMRVAYDLAKAGDPLGAMQLIEEGLKLDPENVDLLEQHGTFAFSAGSKALAEFRQENGQDAPVPPEVEELYRKAITSFERVYEAKGTEMEVERLRTMIAAHMQLGDYEEAVALASRVLETHAEEAALWSIYGDALQKAGRVEEAITALDRVKEIDPEYPNIAVRQGKWLLDEGRLDEAVPALQEAVRRGEQPADQVANLVFANGYTKGVQPKNWAYAVRLFRAAKQFEISDEMRQQIDFWLAYALYNQAVAQQEPQTLETARATLPKFQEVARLLQQVGGYAQRQNLQGNLRQLIANTNTYIEIQEAIIKRGR